VPFRTSRRIVKSRRNPGYYWFCVYTQGSIETEGANTWPSGLAQAYPIVEPVTWASAQTQLGVGSMREATIKRTIIDFA